MLIALLTPPSRDQVIALSGIFMACHQVDHYARFGTGSSTHLETAINGLLNQSPISTEAVYGGLHNVEDGLAAMEKVLGNPKDSSNTLILRYVIGVMHLANKLSRNPGMLNKVGEGIAAASRQAETFSATHANVLANLADLYQQTISTFNFRIQVNGVAEHLQQPAVANRIRCLLFAGIRSAILWQQLKGSRFQLMFRRDTVLSVARTLHQDLRGRQH